MPVTHLTETVADSYYAVVKVTKGRDDIPPIRNGTRDISSPLFVPPLPMASRQPGFWFVRVIIPILKVATFS